MGEVVPQQMPGFSERAKGLDSCPRCDGPTESFLYNFPPALAARFGSEGVWTDPECANEDCRRIGQALVDREEWEAAVKERHIEDLLSRSDLPSRLARKGFENFESGVHSSAARAAGRILGYVSVITECRPGQASAGHGLYLVGGVGTGKTHLAAALTNRLVSEERIPTLFVTVPELLDEMRPGGSQETATSILERAKGADVLVLDDLGAEKPTEWVRERLFVLINHRYRAELPTIYTSNVWLEDLAGHVGDRIASRIIETSEFVLLRGPDYRLLSRRREAERRTATKDAQ